VGGEWVSTEIEDTCFGFFDGGKEKGNEREEGNIQGFFILEQ